MPPLVLHNVPDEERYVGEDGITRPYGLYWPGHDLPGAARSTRRTIPETGSFGKSTRRSRSKTGTPLAKKEDPTLEAGSAIFGAYLAKASAARAESPQRKAAVQQNLPAQPLTQVDLNTNAGSQSRFVHKEPTEVILRGYNTNQEYAAIREYERVAGRICEDYPRDPALENRRYKGDLRDQTALRRQPLTAQEKAKANVYAGGQHWIKVTFESHEAAEIAVESSPISILGTPVYAEIYRGAPLALDAPTAPRSPDGSTTSVTLSSTTVTEQPRRRAQPALQPQAPSEFSSKVPRARIILRPAAEALLPQKSVTERFMEQVPVLKWFSGDYIGKEVPRTQAGDFDWEGASLYWKVCYKLDQMPCCGCLELDGKED